MLHHIFMGLSVLSVANIETTHGLYLAMSLLVTVCATMDRLSTDCQAWPQGTCVRSTGKICIFEGGVFRPCKYHSTIIQFKKAELEEE